MRRSRKSAAHSGCTPGVGEGPTAEKYAAEHLPYLMWLPQVSADNASAPPATATPVELAANHAIHAVSVAATFFGLDTIPSEVNVRRCLATWIQAAATLAWCELTSVSAVAPCAPAPIPAAGHHWRTGSRDVLHNENRFH